MTSIRVAFDVDRHLTVSALATMAYMGIWTDIDWIFEYSNVHALRLLKDSEKERRVRDFKSFLKHYEKECASMQQPNVTLSPLSKQPTTSYGSLHDVRDRCPWMWESWSPSIFPDLAPFDFDVYPEVKSQLNGCRFSSLPELRSATANIISQYNQDWFRAVFNKWVKRHRICIAYKANTLRKNDK